MTDVRLSFGFPLSVAARTDTGLERSNNEDAYAVRWREDGGLLVVVCDGMGGHAAGEVASQLAVETFQRIVGSDLRWDPRDSVREAYMEANRTIIDEGKRTGRRGMGTTTVVGVLRGPEAWVGLVGDSRLFHVRRGHIMWRTTDHTRVQALVERGIISESEARQHPDAGVLTRALGHAKMSNGQRFEPEVHAEPLTLQAGDALVLCTDGLHDLLEDWEVAREVNGRTADEAASALVALALARGGHDNVTVAVVVAGEVASEFDPDADPPPPLPPLSEVTPPLTVPGGTGSARDGGAETAPSAASSDGPPPAPSTADLPPHDPNTAEVPEAEPTLAGMLSEVDVPGPSTGDADAVETAWDVGPPGKPMWPLIVAAVLVVGALFLLFGGMS